MSVAPSSPAPGQTRPPAELPSLLHWVPWIAAGLQLAHVLSLLLLRHPLRASNGLQVLLPVLAFCGCLLQRRATAIGKERTAWAVLAGAFALWTVAEICYLIELYLLPHVAPYSQI